MGGPEKDPIRIICRLDHASGERSEIFFRQRYVSQDIRCANVSAGREQTGGGCGSIWGKVFNMLAFDSMAAILGLCGVLRGRVETTDAVSQNRNLLEVEVVNLCRTG